MKFLLGLLAVIAFANEARASVNNVLDLESHYRTAVFDLVKGLDTGADVRVQVQLKEQKLALPGSGIELQNLYSKLDSDLNENEISAVQIEILGSSKALPIELSKVVEDGLHLPKGVVHVKLGLLPETLRTLAAENQNSNRDFVKNFGSDIRDANQSFSQTSSHLQTLVYGILGLGAAGLLVLLASMFNLNRRLSDLTTQVGKTVNNSASLEAREVTPLQIPREIQSLAISPTPLRGVGGPLDDLSNEALLAVFSDSYWCEEDGYAKWLWTAMSTVQKSFVLSAWPKAQGFVRHLVSFQPMEKNFHTHPHYIQPLALANVSQNDLAQWVRKSPSVWMALSPLRQAHMPFTLIEKFKMSEAPVVAAFPPPPADSSGQRDMRRSFEIGDLTDADELAIMKNPELIPLEARSTVQSLVWLWLLNEDDGREVLSSFSAADLSQVWIGPKELLTKLESWMPAKKNETIAFYCANQKPSRVSPVMKMVCARAFEKLEQDARFEKSA